MSLENKKDKEEQKKVATNQEKALSTSIPDEALDEVNGGITVNVKKIVRTAYDILTK